MSALPASFGKYFLTEKIATGGMAEIYLAKLLGPDGFEKFLIIKKIHPELSNQRQFVEMFVAEAKTLVSLSHGNIVPIYELGMVDSTYFIAMEYIDGPTLDTLLRTLRKQGASLSLTMAAYICAELLKGLDYAHRKGEGVIHRDLSPRNVMISREGEVKLVDFGIAVAHTNNSQTPVQSDLPSGSYPHMSPEQVTGDTLDPRSDLFAMGILLWEMITGRSLFARGSDQDTLDAVTSASIPPPSDYCTDCDAVLDAICKQALQRDKDLRYSSADEFLIAINRFLYSQVETATSQKVSAFIARHCPPTVSEFTRPATIPVSDRPNRAGTAPFVREDAAPRKRSGTVPLEFGHGKRRAETVRSFATNVNFKKNFDPGSADDNEDEDTNDASERESVSASAENAPTNPHATLQLPTANGRDSSAGIARTIVLLTVGALLLGGGTFAFFGMRANPTEVSRMQPLLDGGLQDAAPLSVLADAWPAHDSSPRPALDAGAVVIDARKAAVPKARRIDARVKAPAAEPGSIRIGANPWADVYIDGTSVGRAPGSFPAAAGKHTIELRFRDKRKTMSVMIKSGELTRLGVVDFLAEN